MDTRTVCQADLAVYLIVTGPRLCLVGYVAFPWPKFCGPVPCGISWDNKLEVEIACLTISLPGIGNGIKKLLFTLPPKPDGDATPPEQGRVVHGQDGGAGMKVQLAHSVQLVQLSNCSDWVRM